MHVIYLLVFNCRGGGRYMLCVPSLWLLLGCVHIVLTRILYPLFLDEISITIILLQLTKCKRFVCLF